MKFELDVEGEPPADNMVLTSELQKEAYMRPAINLHSVAHIALHVADLEDTMKLFMDFLGIRPVGAEGKVGEGVEFIRGEDCLQRAAERRMDVEMVVLQVGEFRVNLQRVEGPLERPELDHIAIAAKEQGFAEVMEVIRGSGYDILDEMTIDGKRIMFRARNGLVIEVYSREVYQ